MDARRGLVQDPSCSDAVRWADLMVTAISDTGPYTKPDAAVASSWVARLGSRLPLVKGFTDRRVYTHYLTPRRRKRSVLRCIYWTVFFFPYACLFLVLVASVFFPSYTHRPQHYTDLRNRAEQSRAPGRANINNEKVFIAASIYEKEGALTSGAWGESLTELVDLLGPDNVHLSVYENDADQLTKESLARFERMLPCNKTIVAEDLDLQQLPRVTLPNGETRIKRIAFLAEVRNRALAPLFHSDVTFDRLLYVNDVNFDPVEAAQLLLSTNIDRTGRANYAAACAVDFINAFKFYDRFALRDLEGYTPGIPFYPWFTSAGNAVSRNDVLSGTDAVRVKSCWGGMTAFEAKWFQQQHPTSTQGDHQRNRSSLATLDSESAITSTLRFRHDTDPFWDSSECCLIHADLQSRLPTADTRIFMNPFVRVAYDPATLSWLSLVRRPERLYSVIHDILNYFVGFPGLNERRTEEPGQLVTDTIWEFDDAVKGMSVNATAGDLKGRFRSVERVARPGGFCGTRQLLVINEDVGEGDGERWYKILPPRPAVE
ncbi:glycosyltransferase family 69 protein [Periconia macrospinosa]|uniref:Glycosyltransferase family 69 protein n=1 Tax=Periconia macrospinosa TaxID=97972 RepID=A0A2V1E203_9PLEO|nr:glycosyltransferase family 69 protein [Periconia macrospinosa]